MIKILKEAKADIDFYSNKAKAYKKLLESAIKTLLYFKERTKEKLKTSPGFIVLHILHLIILIVYVFQVSLHLLVI